MYPMVRVSYRVGGGAGLPPSPNFLPTPTPPTPEILKLSMVIIVLSQVLSNNLEIVSEAI